MKTKQLLAIIFIIITFLSSSRNTLYSSTINEDELILENWMMKPFLLDTIEEELILEDWMMKPFVVDSINI